MVPPPKRQTKPYRVPKQLLLVVEVRVHIVNYNNNCYHGGNGGNSSISGTSQTAIGGGGVVVQ